jgi:TolA-binding protein
LPRAVQYKTGSIVYFSGDRSKSVFILKSGKIALTSVDLHDGQEVTEYVKEGEFFGVKDTLGKYSRDETATVVEESLVVHFTPEEFDDFINTKPDLIMKMLKIYSKQLRIIHGDVQNLLTTTNVRFPEEGMINAADYYFRNNKTKQALYFYETYRTKFPGGAYSNLADERLADLKRNAQPGSKTPVSTARTVAPPLQGSSGSSASLVAQGEKSFKNGDYQGAFKMFNEAVSSGDSKILVEAEYRIGCCLFHLGKFNDSIQYLTNLLRTNPKHPRMGEILHYLGLCYKSLMVFDKAVAFMGKAIGYLQPDCEYYSVTSRMLKEMGKGQ